MKINVCLLHHCSLDQLQHMHAAMQQQFVSTLGTRRKRDSTGSLDGGRLFNDAMAWIAQHKVSPENLADIYEVW